MNLTVMAPDLLLAIDFSVCCRLRIPTDTSGIDIMLFRQIMRDPGMLRDISISIAYRHANRLILFL